ncbi:P1 family peptidase [Roseovarius rhodophyticola]|uniref:P1 family peptidase n=1 Tax=Roseovarius rhodophyticola TaxID=3080827 RepID=A0ABZ2TQ28_9RHOB|nr:P1 family peptidase [Roseovarius sp. W115]MDV2930237.1 P1 family peptidase [Roseovarius sp. W115]
MDARPGQRNLITDVPGLQVGQAQDDVVKTGVSVVMGAAPFTAGVHVMGGAPGTRETDLLGADKVVEQVDALVLSGGSAFGLDAASGVADALRSEGRGFAIGDQRVPIVPGAILFDLLNGGDKAWSENPYKRLGRDALAKRSEVFELGSHGAGTGATTADFKGGIGSASLVLPDGITVGAFVAVNALGSAVAGTGPKFWAAPFEFGDEFGALGVSSDPGDVQLPNTKLGQHQATTIGIVATDAALSQAQCTRMAVAAHDGYARALLPSHTPMDGDLIFSLSTADRTAPDLAGQLAIGHASATCISRAVARAVFAARPAAGDTLPCWAEAFGYL